MRRGFRRQRKDWIYTEQGYLANVVSQNAAQVNALAQPLIFSQNAVRNAMFGTVGIVPGANAYQGGYAMPAQRRRKVFAFQGHVIMSPSAWAVGNEFLWGYRLLVAKMDPDTASYDGDPEMSMWLNTVAPTTSLLTFVNTKDCLKEWRNYRVFGENATNGMWRTNFWWSSKRGISLKEDEAVFLWLEGSPSSVNTVRNRWYCRLLVSSDE